jgi:intracellular septation protein A
MTQQTNKQNPLYNIAFNIVLPTIILMKFSSAERLGPTYALILALAFPIGYGIYEFYKERKVNTMSIIGLVSVMLTGGFVLLKLPAEYVVVKETGVPLLIGAIVLISNFTKKPLVKTMLLNDSLFEMDKLHIALDERGNREAFYKKVNLVSYLLVLTFVFSAFLNYELAKYFLVSEPGSEQYNVEIGQMNGWSFPVIALPSMVMMGGILWMLFSTIKKLTGLGMEELMVKK